MAGVDPTMTYERGLLCIGRYVRVFASDRTASKQHAVPGKLVAAYKNGGEVILPNHRKRELIPWDSIHDWVGKNGGPAPFPPPPTKRETQKIPRTGVAMPEMTALENRAMKAEETKAATAEAMNLLREKVEQAETLSLGDLGAQLDAAIAAVKNSDREIQDLYDMIASAKKVRAAHVENLARIRESVVSILKKIDSLGTNG